MKYQPEKTIVIVGGGTAGWLTAGLLAVKKTQDGHRAFHVKVIEPEDIPTIGVGEGSWPTMRLTLHQIGVDERDFLRTCHASFKQGSKFCNWSHGNGEMYYHPFEAPWSGKKMASASNDTDNIGALWLMDDSNDTFSNFAHYQEYLCERHLAPKMLTSNGYEGVTNYGYHFESAGITKFLRQHCCEKLNVEIVSDTMIDVLANEQSDIEAIITRNSGHVKGDFFIDCTGFRALLLKQHFSVSEVSLNHVLFANRALAVQVPTLENDIIQSATVSTAQSAGWIWDIGLSNRRGIGYVYSNEYTNTDQAVETLSRYLANTQFSLTHSNIRELKFSACHLEKFWVRNCVAIGLSAGFVEPLEASSIMLTEVAAKRLSDVLSGSFDNFDAAAKSYNLEFTKRWEEVVHFLKLHYVLSRRSEKFWRDNRDPSSIPSSLQTDLQQWQENPSSIIYKDDQKRSFPSASYQYVYYGMQGKIPLKAAPIKDLEAENMADVISRDTSYQADRLSTLLPTNRRYLQALYHG
jgi:flavin-dependent dehydrogenase